MLLSQKEELAEQGIYDHDIAIGVQCAALPDLVLDQPISFKARYQRLYRQGNMSLQLPGDPPTEHWVPISDYITPDYVYRQYLAAESTLYFYFRNPTHRDDIRSRWEAFIQLDLIEKWQDDKNMVLPAPVLEAWQPNQRTQGSFSQDMPYWSRPEQTDI